MKTSISFTLLSAFLLMAFASGSRRRSLSYREVEAEQDARDFKTDGINGIDETDGIIRGMVFRQLMMGGMGKKGMKKKGMNPVPTPTANMMVFNPVNPVPPPTAIMMVVNPVNPVPTPTANMVMFNPVNPVPPGNNQMGMVVFNPDDLTRKRRRKR